ncbi:MAG TPA: NAD(P)H-hydrate dehydratase [Acidimicrobiia bacterium]
MKPVVTATESRRVDEAHRGDLYPAMERAGHAVAMAAIRHGAGYGSRVAVLAGPGNNGGDGYVAARHLLEHGAGVVVHRLGEPRTADAIRAEAAARLAGVPMRPLADPEPADLVIDALFGGGGRPDLPAEVVAWANHDAPVIAVDFPTGLDPDSGIAGPVVFRATETVTFSSYKTGHLYDDGPDWCGKVTVADIGLEAGRPSAWIAEESDAPRPARGRRAHKWSAGAVLVVGGSSGMVGAATMAARAALEFGAGSVHLATPDPDGAHAIVPQVPAVPLDDVTRFDRFDVVVAGPGLADGDREKVVPLVQASPKVVLDAGALTPSMVESALTGGAEVVVTPHAGEFERLSGVGPGKFSTRSYALRTGVVLLAKGNPTVVTDGGHPVLVTSGTPALATIGTGDVLAGMLGALWARGLGPMEAAISASYWHGVAADQLSRRETVTAEKLLGVIGRWAW